MQIEVQSVKDVFVVVSNTDLTEGKGVKIILGIYESESHADYMGKRKYVMGSDCPIERQKSYRIDDKWYGPVTILSAPEQFVKEDKKLAVKRAAIEKARKMGLTEEDIKDIQL
jgi:hypothetical protein